MALPTPPSNQRRAVADGDETSMTMITKSSCVGSDGCLSQLSCCSSMSHTNGTSNYEVRKRYLHRLGIRGSSNYPAAAAHTDSDSAPSQHRRVVNFTSCSAPEKAGRMRKSSRSPLRQSTSHGAIASSATSNNRQEEIILLRRSVQFTVKLKSDPKDVDKPTREKPTTSNGEEEILETITSSKSSSPSKFELSSAWTALLSRDSPSTTSACSSEPLDGAYDLFSLPSDSSIAASRSSATIIALDRLPSRDSLLSEVESSSMPRRRKVSFDSTVTAATIPSRFSYSNRIRTRLWSGTEDIYANAVRNEKEYAFDGNNWRTAREENDFLRCSSTSSSSTPSPEELVHPVHFSGWTPYQYSSQQREASAMPINGSCSKSSPSLTNGGDGSADERADQDDGYPDEGMFDMD